jgi:hypothetical protein
MKEIKLPKEINDVFTRICDKKSVLDSILQSVGAQERAMWDKLKETYIKYDLIGASIEDGILIIPFDKQIQKE